MKTALETVQAFFAAFERGDMMAASALVDPPWAADFQADQLGHFVAWCQFRDMRAADPSLSGFGSHGKVDSSVLTQYASRKIPSMPGSPTIENLSKLAPVDFLAAFLHGSFLSTYKLTHVCLGDVPFDEYNVYVLYYRQEGESSTDSGEKGDEPPYLEVMVARRRGDNWGVRLGSDFTTSLGLGLGDEGQAPA